MRIITRLASEESGHFIDFNLQTLIDIGIQLFNAIVLALVLTLILYKPVKKFLGARAGKIQEKIDGAEKNRAHADELIAEYEVKLAEIHKERDRLFETARAEADTERKAVLEEARREAAEIKERSIESVAEDKKRLKEESRLYIIELSHTLAKKYINKYIDDEARNRLYDEAIAQLEEAKWQG